MKDYRVCISVLCYLRHDLARLCIESLLAHTSGCKLILTANGSKEAAAYFHSVAATHEGVEVIEHATNLGYKEANRIACERVDTPFVALVNDDVAVCPGWLAMLEQPFWRKPKMAIVGPRGGCNRVQSDGHGGWQAEPEYIEFSTCLIRADVMRDISPWVPWIEGSYCEDANFGLSVRAAGYEIAEVDCPVVHKRAQTSSRMPELEAIAQRNRDELVRRWSYYLQTRKFAPDFIIRRTAAWGDVLLCEPTVRALKQAFPNRKVFVETPLTDVFLRHPDVSGCAAEIDEPGCLTIDLDGAYEQTTETHILDAYHAVAQSVAQKQLTPDRSPRFHVDPNEIAIERSVFRSGGWVALAPSPTTWPAKNWPISRWQELASLLVGDGWNVVLVGHACVESDVVRCDRDRRGKTSLSRLAAVLSCCDLLVGHCSLPLHLAQAVGTPVIGLFGVTSPQFILTDSSESRAVCGTGPSAGMRHRVKGKTEVNDGGVAMATIQVSAVMAAVRSLPERGRLIERASA